VETVSRLTGVEAEKVSLLMRAIETGTGCPRTSSAGRLFDAVSSLTGLVQVSGFEAEAAMRLESCAAEGLELHGGRLPEPYPFSVDSVVRTEELMAAVVEDVSRGADRRTVALRFHRTLAEVIITVARRAREAHGAGKVVLSGGVFQNRLLLETAIERLNAERFEVVSGSRVPVNDGGLALGQAAVAGALRHCCREVPSTADFRGKAGVNVREPL
jgi:hydrogenase maturation protein HypF